MTLYDPGDAKTAFAGAALAIALALASGCLAHMILGWAGLVPRRTRLMLRLLAVIAIALVAFEVGYPVLRGAWHPRRTSAIGVHVPTVLWPTTHDAQDRKAASQTPLGFVGTRVYDAAPQVIAQVGRDKENRLWVHQDGSSIATYLYDGDGMKRMKFVGGARTTLIWDGTDYLQGRS